jgi:hypothetical protein
MLSIHLRLGLPSGLFPSGFHTNNLYSSLFSPIRATCPAHPILLDFIILIELGEEYKLYSANLQNKFNFILKCFKYPHTTNEWSYNAVGTRCCTSDVLL